MAKTIMISNEVYNKLKNVKHSRSFSETIKELMEPGKKKTVEGLKDFTGLLGKNDTEYEKAAKRLDPMYKKWTKSIFKAYPH